MLSDRRGLSPVVATIVLCGVVLVLGISVWSYTYGVSSYLQTYYYEGVSEQIDAISERFTVEHIAYNDTRAELHVWVYNYGSVDVEVDVYVMGDAEGSNVGPTHIPSGELAEITVDIGSLSAGSEVVVEVMSRRQNVVYETYVVPAQG